MPIRFECTSCGKRVKAPDGSGGKRTRCPQCGASLQIPETSVDEVYDAEPAYEDNTFQAEAVYEDTGGYGVASTPKTSEPQRRPCPACGEMIVSSAVKCRFCGEIFDPVLKKKKKKKKRRSSTYDDGEDLTAAEWFVAIVCANIGCIVGIVWLITGNPKGGKMLLVSAIAQIFWAVVSVVLRDI